MSLHLKQHRQGFPSGLTTITETDEPSNNTGIKFSILRLNPGERFQLNSPMEQAILHMEGTTNFTVNNQSILNTRGSLFNESPFSIHVCKDTPIELEAKTPSEIAIFETENDKTFPCAIYPPEQVDNEHRGKGLAQDTSLRFVRTIFDSSNSDPNTELVLGEVINFPGKWSSYPPHHHSQPEIYHYRFTDLRGYGHAELGEDVLKVRHYDTVKILNALDHSQCSAPGYGMYYIWVIRHLPGNRYTVPEFTEEHQWILDSNARFWSPNE